jgi:hypothetical protein
LRVESRDRDRAAVGLGSPAIVSIVVVFPAPLGSRMPNISPGSTLNEMSSTATWSP